MRVHVRNYTCYIQSSEVGVWLTSSLMREYVMASVCLVSSTLWTWLDQKEPLVLETEERGSKVSTITKINMAFIMAILVPGRAAILVHGCHGIYVQTLLTQNPCTSTVDF